MLSAATWWRLADGGGAWLAGTMAAHALLFAVAALWLQWRAPRLRRGPLLWSWRAGLPVLALAALALLADVRGGMLAGALGLGIALPLLVIGMMLEIVPFIGWIELHRRIGRGVQLPGVQRLLPVHEKTRVLLAQVPLLLLPVAVCWPSAWLARVAGLALVLAWGCAWWTLRGVRRRAIHFLSTVEPRP
jgi:Ca2+/Na+ antiporter